MTTTIRYALDSDVFIQAARAYYAFDIAPGFWDALIQHSQAGTICSVDRVKQEIERGKDDLASWVGADFVDGFQPTDTHEILTCYGDAMNWAYAQAQYTDAAKSEFAEEKNADAWLVSYAMAHAKANTATKLVVVTQETFEPNVKRRIKIPNVCKAFSIECINLFQFMRTLGIRLG